MQSREPDGNDIAYVVAAGRANHAGEGGWHGLSGNSSVYGLEIEHTGTSPISEGRQRRAAQIHAAMFGGDVSYVCQHYEWTSRKIDLAEGCNGDTFRAYVSDAMGGYRPPEPEDEFLTTAQYNDIVNRLATIQSMQGDAIVVCNESGAWYAVNGVWARLIPSGTDTVIDGLTATGHGDLLLAKGNPTVPAGVTRAWLQSHFVLDGPDCNVQGGPTRG